MSSGLPFTWPLEAQQGATLRRSFEWADEDGNPADLTGWAAAMHIRRYAHADELLAELTDGDGITLGADGMIELHMAAVDAGALPAGRWVYELTLTRPGDGEVISFAVGSFTVRSAVVRAAAP